MSRKHHNRISRAMEQEELDEGESMVERCRHATERTIRESPMIATMAMFGIGLAIGTMLGSYLANNMSRFGGIGGRRSASRMNRFFDAMGRAVPEAVQRRFGG